MKKNLIVVFVFTTFLYSCESEPFVEDEIEEVEIVVDLIVGKWHLIETYVTEDLIPSGCERFSWEEFMEDNSLKSTIIGASSSVDPIYCPLYPEDGWTWESLGDELYKIKFLDEPGQIFTIYIEGDNLVFEHPDGVTKTIYEPWIY